jgi:hypothetical protein
VARWFFHVGGAAATVARSISAYDMAMSTATYGPTARYVSRQRLQTMLDYEFHLLLTQVDATRGERSTFFVFVFANTVAARSYTYQEDGHGWLGIRFQTHPREDPSDLLIHVRLLDRENLRQQEALGVLGVNLLYAAFHHAQEPDVLIGSLLDGLTRDRTEVDVLQCTGPAFAGVDNRLLSLQLVEQRLTDAAMFTVDGQVVQPSEVLYKRPILVERGSFRPPTNLTLDLLACALERFRHEPQVQEEPPVVLLEMTLRTNEIAKRLITETIAIEQDRAKTMESYLPKFSKVLPWIKVARYYQLENKIRAAVQYHQLAKGIPLIGVGKLEDGHTTVEIKAGMTSHSDALLLGQRSCDAQ